MARSGTSSNDGALIAALIGGANVEDAAQAAGLSRRTAFRRLADPTFVRALNEAKRARLDRVVDVLTAGSLVAVTTLVDLLAPGTPPSVRHAAARTILDIDERRRQQAEIEARLSAIKAQLRHEEPK